MESVNNGKTIQQEDRHVKEEIIFQDAKFKWNETSKSLLISSNSRHEENDSQGLAEACVGSIAEGISHLKNKWRNHEAKHEESAETDKGADLGKMPLLPWSSKMAVLFSKWNEKLWFHHRLIIEIKVILKMPFIVMKWVGWICKDPNEGFHMSRLPLLSEISLWTMVCLTVLDFLILVRDCAINLEYTKAAWRVSN